MAATWTPSTEKPSEISGSLRMVEGVMTLDAASGVANLGLNRVIALSVSPISVATGGFGVAKNHTSGNVRIGSGASGDDFEVVAWGN